MHIRTFLFATLAIALSTPIAYARQHEGHQAAAPVARREALVTQCAQAQGVVTSVLEGGLKRLEDARLSNSPSALRAAADDVQASLIDVRVRLEPCAMMSVAPGGEGGHTMPVVPPVPSVAPAPPGTEPRSAVPSPGADAPRAPAPAAPHQHPTVAPAPRPGAARPTSPSRPAAPATADPHAGHATPEAKSSAPAAATPVPSARATQPPGGSRAEAGAAQAMTTAATPATALGDLKCRNEVDPKTAPRMLYQGRTYYFCTESDRTEFAKDPGKYVSAPAQKLPAHGH